MIKKMRQWFNTNFSEEQYSKYVSALQNTYPGALLFRVAETPIFVDKAFQQKMLHACEHIVDVITRHDFKTLTDAAIPKDIVVPNENEHTDFIAFDFGICQNDAGELEPQLIEMQGFPSLFCYQILHESLTRQYFPIPDNFSAYLNGFTEATYIQTLREIIVGDEDPASVILLEIYPEKQKTKVDFYCTETYIGIKTVCLTALIKEGNQLFYKNEAGEKTLIKRIYNRIIFDDLQQQPEEVQAIGKILFEDLDVVWVPHPNWFYRISKYTLPFIEHPYVPETHFLNKIETIPTDLENYVLKPLFSFAGQGVIIDVQPEDITNIPDPENWILQRKVKYADVIPTPDVPAKAEIRIFYFWKKNHARPFAVNNLARLSKGKMIGVRYNSDKEWVGGSLAYFEL